MKGPFGCQCAKCQGAGTIHPDLQHALEAIEMACDVEIYVTSGYRCPEHNKEVGGKDHSRHMGDPRKTPEERLLEKTAFAVDIWPLDRGEKPGPRWNRREFAFRTFCKPFFDYVYTGRGTRSWFLHAQLNEPRFKEAA